MKLNDVPDPNGRQLHSEGKTLEIIPVLTDASGLTFTLPPVSWTVPNWLMGFLDHHVVARPITMYFNQQYDIPGSRSTTDSRLTFMVRIMEHQPDSEPHAAREMDLASTLSLIEAIKQANIS